MFRIGDFSRLARVTIKTLHHYDEAGLLQPKHVDRQSGYRYYDASQLPRLHRILLLKDLGFSLEHIRALLHADADTLGATLDSRRRELAETIAADQSRLRRLEALRLALDRQDQTDQSPVLLRDSPAIEVYSVRERVPHFGTPMQTLFERAEALVAAERARSAARPRCKASASITYRGPYEQTPLAYAQLLEWMNHSGMRLAGPLREVYHRYGADQVGYSLPASVLADRSDDFVTELLAPVTAHS